MDNIAKVIDSFQDSLKMQSNRKPSIYKNKNDNKFNNSTRQMYNPKDIISNITTQLKAIRSAEYISTSNSNRKTLEKYKNTNLLPVNMLLLNDELPQQKHTNKYETQFELDTQLIDIIEKAENNNTEKGVTQEFDVSFNHISIETSNDHKNIDVGDDFDKTNYKNSLHSNSMNVDSITSLKPRNMEADIKNNDVKNVNNLQLEENCTELIDKCMEIESNLNDDFVSTSVEREREINISPVLNINKKLSRRSESLSPLVYNLDSFERFEKIAIPIVEGSADIILAKHLINSQILGNELVLHGNYEVETDAVLPLSPVIKINKSNFKNSKSINMSSSEVVKSNSNINSVEIVVDMALDMKKDNIAPMTEYSNINKITEDEILFSSDEEKEHKQENIKDLPFTCALHTSFYDQPDVLDKTMYVGFQTASNKSIQISTASFTNAKNLLDDIEPKESINNPTLLELVEICDSFSSKNDKKCDIHFSSKDTERVLRCDEIEISDKKIMERVKEVDNISFNQIDNVNFTKVCENKEEKQFQCNYSHNINAPSTPEYIKKKIIPEKRKWGNFMTASNKKIRLSDKALATCNRVFQGIDLNETFDCNKEIDEQNIRKNRLEEKETIVNDGNENTRHKSISPNPKLEEVINDYPGIDDNILHEFQAEMLYPENLNKPCTNKEYLGFKTANNIEIKISETAMAKSIKIFEDINLVDKLSDNTEQHDIFDHKTAVTTVQDSNKKENIKRNDVDNNIKETVDFLNLSTTNKKYVGFKTANNKIIEISKEAFAKSKRIFQDIDNSEAVTSHYMEPTVIKEFLGFKIANNKKIEVSEQALTKSKIIFQGIDKPEAENSEYMKPTTIEEFVGFKTANNKKIEISMEALAKSKRILQDINDTEGNISREMSNIDKESRTNERFVSFKTAHIKKREISQQVLAKSRIKCQKDDNSEAKIIYETDVEKIITNNKEFVGFKTANNKKIEISEEALARSKRLLQDINYSEAEAEKNITDIDFNKTSTTIEMFVGFKTASNKEVKISEQALARTKNIFSDIDYSEYVDTIGTDKDVDKQYLQHPTLNSNKPNFVGFTTASNKQIKISEQAINEARNIFLNIDNNDDNENRSTNTLEKLAEPMLGFKMANNKLVNISDKALEKSKRFFTDLDNEQSNVSILRKKIYNKDIIGTNNNVENVSFLEDSNSKCNNAEVPFKGFQTANNKPVKISKEALLKTRNVFKDIDTNYGDNIHNERIFDKEIIRKTTNVNEFIEHLANDKYTEDTNKSKENFPIRFDETPHIQFQTASYKKVNVSDNVLEKRRRLLSEINSYNNIKDDNDSKSIRDIKKDDKIIALKAFSFKTGNNDDIKVHEEALTESKKYLTNLKDANENNKINDDDVSLELINTQVIKNFDETLCTEDFLETPKQSKRSGSPILSCPKPKKRKPFTTPYRNEKIEKDTFGIDNIDKKDNSKNLTIDDTYKKDKTMSLKDIRKLETGNRKQLDPYIMNFSYDTLLNFEFNDTRNDLTRTKMNVDSLKSYFLGSVNRKLVPDKWLDNHLKMILWKLISYEVTFPHVMSGVCTSGNVIKQLNYRYRRELFNAERPALRKILERDDTPAKTLVLCVVDIYVNNSDSNTKTELLLSDGWYCVKATIDNMLVKYVRSGKIEVGTKLITNGAELLNCEQGIAPWEDTSAVRLKIYGNSTRRARWDARLGYHGNGAILSHLSNVAPDGGKVGRVRLLVTRVYPPLYVEKFVDGSTVTRSDRLEQIHQMKYESDRQALMEKLYEEVQKELGDEESQESQDIRVGKTSLDSGSQIARLLRNSKDPSQFKANLTESQQHLLEEYNARKRDSLLQDIQARVRNKIERCGQNVVRNTVPLLKVRVADVVDSERGKVDVTKALLSIWKPNDELLDIITEGACIEVLNVVPTAVRYSELQLSAGRQTLFKQTTIKQTDILIPYIKALHRICYPIKQLTDNPTMITDYNEIDTAGLIIDIYPSNKDFKSNNQFQNVYLTDEYKNIICVNFWGGIKKFGYENILDTGQIVTCINLQKRYGNTKRGIPQYRATEYTYFTKTPKSVGTRQLMVELSNKISADKDFIDDCVRIKNSILLNSQMTNISPYRFVNRDNVKGFIESPLSSNVNQHEFSLTGLDFESTFKQTDTQDLSPKRLQRKKVVNEKIRKLSRYGEPPPLSPLNIINKSKNATCSYKSPLIKSDVNNVGSTIQSNIASVKNTPKKGSFENICGSPVLSVKKTFKNVNPVKLNFNSVAIEENNLSDVDNFPGDFDGSPPLSLD